MAVTVKAKVGGFDRAIRVIAGIAVPSLVFILEGGARGWRLTGLGLLTITA